MPRTIIGVNDPKAVKKQSAFLAVDVSRQSYWNKKFMGVGTAAKTPLQTLTHLENDAGDEIAYDLSLQLKGKPTQGDNILRGKEEDLKFATDKLLIDQLRTGVNTGGKMSRKRTIHNMREVARSRSADYWARLFDETIQMYLSGSRGINPDFIEGLDFTGYAGNAFAAPDSKHIMYGGSATEKANVAVGDIMSLALVDRLKARAAVMGGGTEGIPAIQPVEVDGEEHYVLVMHPWQAYDMRTAAGTENWLAVQKAAAAAEGRNNPIFKGGLGMHNNVVLHESKLAIIFSDYGAANPPVVNAARALFLGRQAGVVAFGSAGTGMRYDWHEEMEDRGNQLVVTSGTIMGVKKSRYTINGTARDFGVIAADTAAKDPN